MAVRLVNNVTEKKTAHRAIETSIVNDLQIIKVPIDSIKLWKDNPRKNDSAVPKLAEIIKQHGFKSPLIVWRANRTIYKGNTTWKAAKLLGLSEVPTIMVDFPSEAAAKAYGIDDNKSGELSGWDYDVLRKLMSAVTNSTVKPLAFSEKELLALQKGIFATKLNVEKIPKYNEDDDTFDICVTVPPKDKDIILSLINQTLKTHQGHTGVQYVASAY